MYHGLWPRCAANHSGALGCIELFDLRNDKRERHSLARTQPKLAVALLRECFSEQQRLGDGWEHTDTLLRRLAQETQGLDRASTPRERGRSTGGRW